MKGNLLFALIVAPAFIMVLSLAIWGVLVPVVFLDGLVEVLAKASAKR